MKTESYVTILHLHKKNPTRLNCYLKIATNIKFRRYLEYNIVNNSKPTETQ